MLHLIGQSQPATESGRRPVDLFNQPNLERSLRHDRGHGTLRFAANQIDIATTWQRIEEDPPAELGERQRHRDVRVRNHRQWLAESEVDVQSSVQMMFDIFAQTIEVSLYFGQNKIMPDLLSMLSFKISIYINETAFGKILITIFFIFPFRFYSDF